MHKPARLLAYLTWAYFLLTVTACAALYLGGDRWWPASLLLFGPRWLAALPLSLLVPLTMCLNRRLLFPLLLAALLIFIPFMGLRFSFAKSEFNSGHPLRIVTCNLKSGGNNEQALVNLVSDVRADVVALQECAPDMARMMPGWHVIQEGGLVLMSRRPFKSQGAVRVVQVPEKWHKVHMLYGVVQMPEGDITFCTVHLPTPRLGLQDLLSRKTLLNPARNGTLVKEILIRENTSRIVRTRVDSLAGPVVVAGDFNMPVESVIYRKTWGNFDNAFDRVGRGYGFSQRAVVHGFRYGARIDHVLTGKGLSPRVCEVGPEVGSDHLPMIADIGFSR